MTRFIGLSIFIIVFSLRGLYAATNPPDSLITCSKAFMYKTDDFAVANTVNICLNNQVPVGYESKLDMAVCDDKLCANVYLKVSWDMAGNYIRFDTIEGHPLTKFDHKRFTDTDYQKLNQILKDRNSMLQIIEKADLVDKNVKLKSATVDAVTGATSSTVKNAVVEGAGYSSYVLWRLVNGSIRDSIRSFTLRNYSEKIAFRLLDSDNFESQLFALKQLSSTDYETYFERLVSVMQKSSPIVCAYIINKMPLPFRDQEKNRKLTMLFPNLDEYSKSIFLNRILNDKLMLNTFAPLMLTGLNILDPNQVNTMKKAIRK